MSAQVTNLFDKPNDELCKRSQGLLTKVFILKNYEKHITNPDIISYIGNFVEWALYEAKLVRGEFPEEALIAYHIRLYNSQVENNGHNGFLVNYGSEPDIFLDLTRGLSMIGADDVAENYENFIKYITENRDHGDGKFDEDQFKTELNKFDKKFYKLTDECNLMGKVASWLGSLPIFNFLPEDKLIAEPEQVISRNKLRNLRKAAELAELDMSQKPIWTAILKTMCDKAELNFEDLNMYRQEDALEDLIIQVKADGDQYTFYMNDNEEAFLSKVSSDEIVASLSKEEFDDCQTKALSALLRNRIYGETETVVN